MIPWYQEIYHQRDVQPVITAAIVQSSSIYAPFISWTPGEMPTSLVHKGLEPAIRTIAQLYRGDMNDIFLQSRDLSPAVKHDESTNSPSLTVLSSLYRLNKHN